MEPNLPDLLYQNLDQAPYSLLVLDHEGCSQTNSSVKVTIRKIPQSRKDYVSKLAARAHKFVRNTALTSWGKFEAKENTCDYQNK